MKVLFVSSTADSPLPPAKPLQSWIQVGMGISYISSMLRSAGTDTKLLVPRRGSYRVEVDEALAAYAPDMVCFTAVATEYPFIARVAAHVRAAASRAFLIIGGPHASLQSHEVIRGSFDAVCVGEGEYPMVELAEQMSRKRKPGRIRNLHIKGEGALEINETREFIGDLDALPFPDRELWRDAVEGGTEHTILLGRGCPHGCTYCSNHALRRLAGGRYVRLRSVANVIQELRELVESYRDVSEIFFEVETITTNLDWAYDFCAALKEFNRTLKSPIRFGTNIRLLRNRDLKELFRRLADAGFASVNIGIESGSEKVRRETLKRDYANEDILRAFAAARAYEIAATAYNLVGLPGETPDDFKQTVAINRACQPDRNFLSIFYPYPGTELHRVCRERGLKVDAGEEAAERFRATLGLPEFPDRKVNRCFRWFDWRVYRGRRPLMKILAYAAIRTLGAHPRLYRLYRSASSRGVIARLKRKLK